MASNDKFREQYKVEVDEAFDVIRKLNESMKLYYPDNNQADQRTQALRSGENVYLTIMMLSRILYTIQNESEGLVDARITMRSKAQESQSNKENRDERKKRKDNGENVDLRDILACTVIIDRVHCSPKFKKIFKPGKIQELYDTRNENLQLMEVAIEFIKKMIRNVILPSADLYHKELTQEEKEEIIRQCDDILKNIKTYYAEEGEETVEDKDDENQTADEKKDKKKTKKDGNSGLKIEKYIADMCTWLLDQKIEENKKKLKKIIVDTKSRIEEEKDESKKKKLQLKQKELMDTMERIKELETKNKKNAIIKEFEDLFFDVNDLNLYAEIKKYLEDKKLTMEEQDKKEVSNEQLISQLSIVTLYMLLKLQFQNNKSKYQGKTYDTLVADLTTELRAYKYYEIDRDENGRKNKYDNMTYTDVNNLLWNVIQLNSCLSDKLQCEIVQYQMEDYLILEFLQRGLNEEGYSIEVKIKTNGYFAIHYDFEKFEFKVTTDYRDKVMTRGSAAYANRKK